MVGCLRCRRQSSGFATLLSTLTRGLAMHAYRDDSSDAVCLACAQGTNVCDELASGPPRSSRRSISRAQGLARGSSPVPRRIWRTLSAVRLLPAAGMRQLQERCTALVVPECTSFSAVLFPARRRRRGSHCQRNRWAPDDRVQCSLWARGLKPRSSGRLQCKPCPTKWRVIIAAPIPNTG